MSNLGEVKIKVDASDLENVVPRLETVLNSMALSRGEIAMRVFAGFDWPPNLSWAEIAAHSVQAADALLKELEK